ncbi:hypothetical protein DSO57_1010766 [Entomophthora muscae]|uniref:Uncharacterized protein n=1 Tax=Entomophthora muscae TaxID=34485 RepID=A0ACC2UGG3_9FUNG|nr:hypothetical protein DSO57_1010766 [Entomophthora muscae]
MDDFICTGVPVDLTDAKCHIILSYWNYGATKDSLHIPYLCPEGLFLFTDWGAHVVRHDNSSDVALGCR